MNNSKNILIAILVLILLLTASFLAGRFTKNCPEPKAPVIETGHKEETIPLPPVDMPKEPLVKWRTKFIPGEIDSSIVNQLMSERELLAKRLDSMKVKSVVQIDTLWGANKDTVKVKIDDFKDTIGLYVGFTPRKFQIETRTIYLQPPPREWWDNPYVAGAGGILLGIVIRSIAK